MLGKESRDSIFAHVGYSFTVFGCFGYDLGSDFASLASFEVYLEGIFGDIGCTCADLSGRGHRLGSAWVHLGGTLTDLSNWLRGRSCEIRWQSWMPMW